jgi:hypothetical protein
MSERQSRRATIQYASESRIAFLASAGLYLKATQDSFDLGREQTDPEWCDLDVSSPARSDWNDTPRLAVAQGRWS